MCVTETLSQSLWVSRLPLASLSYLPEELCGCCLTWFVLGCWSSMASVLSVAPVSLELCSSPPTSIHPLHRCAGYTELLQSQQASPGTHPTGGTISRGLQNCLEEWNPNKITIDINFFFSFSFGGSSEQGLAISFLLFHLLSLYFLSTFFIWRVKKLNLHADKFILLETHLLTAMETFCELCLKE